MTAPSKTVRCPRISPHLVAALAAFVLATTACRSVSPAEKTPPPSTERLQSLELFHGKTGESATWQQLEAQVDQADVVVIGELHGHPLGLPYAALLYQGSLERNEQSALALEFVSRDRQYALDAFAAGLIEMDGLQSAMEGSRGSTVRDHGSMIEASREAGRPVYAANAPRIYTTVARKQGYEVLKGLNPEQRRLFDVPDPLPGEAYQARFFEFMRGGHDGGTKESVVDSEPTPPTDGMRSVFRSQALWDATMSSSASKAVDDGNRPVFLVVGQFHCDTDGGTVELLRQKQPSARILVVSVSDTWSETLLEDDKDRADFIVYVGPSSPGD